MAKNTGIVYRDLSQPINTAGECKQLPTPEDVKSRNVAAFEAVGWTFTYYPPVYRPSIVVLAGLETALKAKA